MKVLTIGYPPSIIKKLVVPIQQKTDYRFINAMVSRDQQTKTLIKENANIEAIQLIDPKDLENQNDAFNTLVNLESYGIPTVSQMIAGDRELKNLDSNVSIRYINHLVKRLSQVMEDVQPDIILASHDNAHSSISLAIAKKMNIPWVAMVFPVIPDNLTAFSKNLSPCNFLPIKKISDCEARKSAVEALEKVRSKSFEVVAYRPPISIKDKILRFFNYIQNFYNRIFVTGNGDTHYIMSISNRFKDIIRRKFNSLFLPKELIHEPPPCKYVFFPLHMLPESVIDVWEPFFQDQLGLIKQISLALPADTLLVVKLHFSDPDNYTPWVLRKLAVLHNVRIVFPNTRGFDFVSHAALVIGINGTALLEAALLGKPTILFGDSPYIDFPLAERAESFKNLHSQIFRLLRTKGAGYDEIVDAFAKYIQKHMPGRVNNWRVDLSENDIAVYSNCFHYLNEYLASPGVRENWYLTSPFAQKDLE